MDVVNQNSEMTAVGNFSLLCFFFFRPCIMDGRVNIKWIRLLTSLWFTFIFFPQEKGLCLAIFFVFCFLLFCFFVLLPQVSMSLRDSLDYELGFKAGKSLD